MIVLTAVTPFDPGWNEATMPVNIGGDARRAICLYRAAGAGTCDGTYRIWARNTSFATNPWVRVGAPIAVAASAQGHAITNMEELNCFNKLYVSADGGAAADNWFLASGGNQGYE